MTEPSTLERAFDLRLYVLICRRRWWMGLVAIVVTATLVMAWTLQQDNVYEAEARLFVGQQSISQSEIQVAQSLTTTSLALVKSYAEAIQSRPIADAALTAIGLSGNPDSLLERVTARPITDTQIIRLTYQDRDPVRAMLITNALVTSFIQALGRIDPSESGGAAVQVSMLEPAKRPSFPVSPKPVTNGIISLFLGSLLGVAVMLTAERLDSTIRARDDVEAASGRPVLAIVPHVATAKGAIVAAHGTPAGEAYRTLRSAVQHVSSEGRVRVLAVTSPEAADGKTSTSFNLALAFAEGGVQAYLIEADLRRPTLAKNLGIQTNGLTSYLSDASVDPEQIVSRTSTPFLHVIAADTPSDAAGELLQLPKMRQLIHELAVRARIVVVDTPPILAVSDALALTDVVDGFLVVVRSGKTKSEHLRETMRILGGAGATVYGIVVNDMSRAGGGTAYGYGYYAYGGYTAESDRNDENSRVQGSEGFIRRREA